MEADQELKGCKRKPLQSDRGPLPKRNKINNEKSDRSRSSDTRRLRQLESPVLIPDTPSPIFKRGVSQRRSSEEVTTVNPAVRKSLHMEDVQQSSLSFPGQPGFITERLKAIERKKYKDMMRQVLSPKKQRPFVSAEKLKIMPDKSGVRSAPNSGFSILASSPQVSTMIGQTKKLPGRIKKSSFMWPSDSDSSDSGESLNEILRTPPKSRNHSHNGNSTCQQRTSPVQIMQDYLKSIKSHSPKLNSNATVNLRRHDSIRLKKSPAANSNCFTSVSPSQKYNKKSPTFSRPEAVGCTHPARGLVSGCTHPARGLVSGCIKSGQSGSGMTRVVGASKTSSISAPPVSRSMSRPVTDFVSAKSLVVPEISTVNSLVECRKKHSKTSAAVAVSPEATGTSPIEIIELDTSFTPTTKRVLENVRQMEKDEELARKLQMEMDMEFAQSLQHTESSHAHGSTDINVDNSSHDRDELVAASFASPFPITSPRTIHSWNPTRRNSAAEALASMRAELGMFELLGGDNMFEDHLNPGNLLAELAEPRQRRSRRGGRRRGRGSAAVGGSNDYEALLNLAEIVGDAKEKGLSRPQVDRLPIRTYKTPQGQDTPVDCNICMCDYEDGDHLKILPCFHEFHNKCIDKWIMKNATCPVCRVAVEIR